jgi:hypothetical protein
MIRTALPLAFILLAGCARSEEARYTQFDNNSALAANTQSADDDDEALAIGAWRTGLQSSQAVIEFGPAGAAPIYSISCDSRRNLVLQRHGAAPPGDLPQMLITVGSETQRLSLAGTGAPTPMMRATLPANSPFRGVLIGAAIPIIVRIGDSPPLALPPSPLIGTYAGQCAEGALQPVDAPGNGLVAVEEGAGNAATANGAAVIAN